VLCMGMSHSGITVLPLGMCSLGLRPSCPPLCLANATQSMSLLKCHADVELHKCPFDWVAYFAGDDEVIDSVVEKLNEAWFKGHHDINM